MEMQANMSPDSTVGRATRAEHTMPSRHDRRSRRGHLRVSALPDHRSRCRGARPPRITRTLESSPAVAALAESSRGTARLMRGWTMRRARARYFFPSALRSCQCWSNSGGVLRARIVGGEIHACGDSARRWYKARHRSTLNDSSRASGEHRPSHADTSSGIVAAGRIEPAHLLIPRGPSRSDEPMDACSQSEELCRLHHNGGQG
jgi:hypothetical protein